MGPSSSPNLAHTPTPLLQHCRALGRTPSHFVSQRSTNSLDAPRQPVPVFSLNPRITCMANANARSSTHGDIRGHFRRRSSIPTQPTGAANSLSNERVCHDTLPWLISVSLDGAEPMSPATVFFENHEQLRDWCHRKPESATELVVGFVKTGTGCAGLAWPQAVDEALCVGWIDGVRHRIDDKREKKKFTSRKPNTC